MASLPAPSASASASQQPNGSLPPPQPPARSNEPSTPSSTTQGNKSTSWAQKYRGATIQDLDPPPALSTSPSTPLHTALLTAFERDYTHLTVTSSSTRALLGYLNIPRLKTMLAAGTVKEGDCVKDAMLRFHPKKKKDGKEGKRDEGRVYKVITMGTTLEELEAFFDEQDRNQNHLKDGDGGGEGGGGEGERGSDFAVVTDEGRRFVLGVVTRADLEEFVRRRP